MITAIGFSGGFRLGQMAIQAATFDLSAHCFAVVQGGNIIDATYHGGVKERKLSNLDAAWCKLIPVNLTVSQNIQFELWLRRQIGKKYDTSYFRAAFHPSRGWQEDDRWWCSELIGAGLVEVEALTIPKMNRLTPRNLRRRLEELKR